MKTLASLSTVERWRGGGLVSEGGDSSVSLAEEFPVRLGDAGKRDAVVRPRSRRTVHGAGRMLRHDAKLRLRHLPAAAILQEHADGMNRLHYGVSGLEAP